MIMCQSKKIMKKVQFHYKLIPKKWQFYIKLKIFQSSIFYPFCIEHEFLSIQENDKENQFSCFTSKITILLHKPFFPAAWSSMYASMIMKVNFHKFLSQKYKWNNQWNLITSLCACYRLLKHRISQHALYFNHLEQGLN